MLRTSVEWLRRTVLPALVVLVQAPFWPHRALSRLSAGRRFVWLGFAAYFASGLLPALWAATDTVVPPARWTVHFHPMMALAQDVFSDLPWPVLLAVLGAEVLTLTLLCALFSVAAHALIETEISTWRLSGAMLLVLSSLSLWSLLLVLAPTALTAVSTEWWFLVGYVAGVVLYLTVALVTIERLDILKVLWIEALTIMFAPVWLIGAAIHVVAFALRRHSQITQSSACMLILRPRAAFDRLACRAQTARGLAAIICVHLVVMAIFLVAARLFLFSGRGFPNLLAWMVLFQKSLAIQVYFGTAIASVEPGNVLSGSLSYLDGLDDNLLLYPYIVLAALATSLAFTSAVHLTLPRMMTTTGSFRHLLGCMLCIADLGTLFFVPYVIVCSSIATSLGSFIWWPLLAWSGVVHVMAIQRVYALPAGRALGGWFGAVMLLPVSISTVIATAALEVARPLRVRAAGAELQDSLEAFVVALRTGDPVRIESAVSALVARYSDRSEIGRRARAAISLAQIFPDLYEVAPDLARKHLVELSRSPEPAMVTAAAGCLRATLESHPEHVLRLLWSVAREPGAAELLGQLAAITAPSRLAELAGLLHALLTEVREERLLALLVQADTVLAGWRDVPRGEELSLTYQALRELRQATTVVDLERAQDGLLPIANLQDPLLVDTAGLLRTLLDVAHYLTYYGRADFENKIPYLAAPSMILVDESRKLEKAPFAPEDGVLRLLIPHLQNIILREFDGLRGRADLRFELEPSSVPFQSELSLVLMVRNQGNAAAEQLRIDLVCSEAEGFIASGEQSARVELLSPKREVRLEFAIRPTEPRRLRIPFTVAYDDLERRGRTMPFASLVEVLEESTVVAPAQPPSHRLKNPYIAGLPVQDPAMFFGREDVFRFIREHLAGAHEKNILVLRGQRRTGKTSILYQLGRQLDELYIPVILDVQGFASSGVDRLLYWIAAEITRALQQRGFAVQRPNVAAFKDDPYTYFRDVFVEGLWQVLPYQRVLLAFDEFEEMDARVRSGKLDADVFPYLRNLMQHTPRLDFLFAGTYRLQQITSEYWSILFNIALFKDIGFMKPEDVEKTIRQPVKGYMFYDDLAVDKIIRITAGQPYFVQLIGSKLVDDYHDHGRFYFGLQDVNRVLDAVLVGGANQFDYLWEQSSAIEQVVLAAMARVIKREGTAASLSDLMRLLDRFEVGVTRTQVLTAVRSLLTRDLLVSDADLRQFEYKIDLVRLWLDQYKGFGIVVEAFRERARTEEQVDVAATIRLGEPTAAFVGHSREPDA